MSIEFVATLTQSLTNFHKTVRREKKAAAEKKTDRGDMAHVKLCKYCKRSERQRKKKKAVRTREKIETK